jgi:hypothetical protein
MWLKWSSLALGSSVPFGWAVPVSLQCWLFHLIYREISQITEFFDAERFEGYDLSSVTAFQ